MKIPILFRTILVGVMLSSNLGGAVTITNDTTISPSDIMYENADIVVSNAVLTVDGAHTFASLVVAPGAAVTHTFIPSGFLDVPRSVTNEVVTLVDTNPVALLSFGTLLSNRVVDASNSVTYVENQDYQVTLQGSTIFLNRTTNSTIADGATVLVSYDLVAAETLGMSITLSGNLDVLAGGQINANAKGHAGGQGSGFGGQAGSPSSGAGGGHGGYGGLSASNAPGGNCYGNYDQPVTPGSGGGLGANGFSGGNGGGAIKFVVSGTATINGVVSANGQDATNSRAGGGAGGSVWIAAQTIGGTGSVTANGGKGEPILGGGGGGGRIAITCNTNNCSGLMTAFGGSGWRYGGAGTIYTKTNLPLARGLLLVDNAGHAGTNSLLALSDTGVDLLVRNNANVRPSGTWSVHDVTIDSSSAIIADGFGNPAGTGPGAGANSSTYPDVRPCSGGGYGGYGGMASTNVLGGNVYGAVENTSVVAGSGGGQYTFFNISIGGAGGGVINMNIQGVLLNNGKISANGLNGSGRGGGGGSGGGISIIGATITGTGLITANGGNGADSIGGGGGGGRIYLSMATNSFSGLITAYGGTGANNGGAGTIYFYSDGSGEPSLLIADNGGRIGTNTLIGSTTLAAKILVRNQANLALPPVFSADEINVVSNGRLIYFGNGSGTNTIVANKIVVNADAIIGADGAGTTSANIPSYIGGGHGGLGGYANTNINNTIGSAYGSVTAPTTAGTGGGNAGFTGGSGGGALRFIVTGDMTVNGRISSNGRDGSSGGGGAGGSIWITAGRMLGSGSITANGGSCLGPIGGGGGGGRIALFPRTNSFIGKVTAYGGSGFVGGGAGTIYQETIDPIGPTVRFITLDNGGRIGTNTPNPIATGANLLVTNGAVASFAGAFSFPSLIVGSNSAVVVGGPSLTFSNALIHPGGAVHSDGLGTSTTGRGGNTGVNVQLSIYYNGGGGGHGGYGGPSASVFSALTGRTFFGSGGNSYGSTIAPASSGSPGGGNPSLSSYPFGGVGGGAVRMIVSGTLTNNGRISADGTFGSGNYAGGGSGGSVWLTLGTLTGTGLISANGGPGILPGGGGGGGGRIAVTFDSSTFTGSLTAYGGSGANYGGAGTVYIKTNSAPYAQLVINNGDNAGTNTTYDPAFLGDLTIFAHGRAVIPSSLSSQLHNLLIKTNGFLIATTPSQTSRRLFISGSAKIDAGGVLAVDGAGGGGIGNGSTDTGFPIGGGGHGGYGSLSVFGGGAAYGSISSPGSVGGNGAGSGVPGGAGIGGGALWFTVSNAPFVVNGRVSADGFAGDSAHGGGAGGSLRLDLAHLLGSGSISANGGTGYGATGGGAGGRIAIYSDSNSFTGVIMAGGGGGAAGGGAGTVYLHPNSGAPGQLIIDNAGITGTNTPLSSNFGIPLQPFDLTVSGNAVVMPITPLPVLRNFTMATNSQLTPNAGNTNVTLAVLQDMTIASGCVITADGKGFGSGTGVGRGATLFGNGSGGGYGGNGGDSQSGALGGTNYGSMFQPVDRGSGGGAGTNNYSSGSEGGGAFSLRVGGTLKLDGILSANGNPGLQDNSGGGAGGSVWIKAGAITGAGNILANGGAGELFGGGGGGGGRIAIYSPTNSYVGGTNMNGGFGSSSGQDGTIYTSAILNDFQVVSASPTGVVNAVVSQVDLIFNEAIDPVSVTTTNFTLFTPNGTLPATNISTSLIGLSTVRVSFPFQRFVGDYHLEAAPFIRDIFGQTMAQPFTNSFTIVLPTISGTVTNSDGSPIAGVLLRLLPNNGYDVTTDSAGNYSIGLPSGWFATATPSFGSNMFVPGSYYYSNFTSSVSNQNFLMVETISPNLNSVISGTNLFLNWNGLAGVTYQAEVSTNLINWQTFGAALSGTNGLMQLLVPVDDEPQEFVRLRASN